MTPIHYTRGLSNGGQHGTIIANHHSTVGRELNSDDGRDDGAPIAALLAISGSIDPNDCCASVDFPVVDPDPISVARGVLLGIAIGTSFYASIAALVWWLV
jgi:hypothetical protein